MHPLEELKIDIHADGADLGQIKAFAALPYVKGITTNPTLMRQAEIENYELFAKSVLEAVPPEKLVSFEVMTDDPDEMLRQAIKIASWGTNVLVKIPIVNSENISTAPLIERLGKEGVNVNVTAVTTIHEAAAVSFHHPAVISIFAGRIADSGMDPEPTMRAAAAFAQSPTKILWASTREVFNIYQAQRCECGIITVPPQILGKAIDYLGRDMEGESQEIARMFSRDAKQCGYRI